MKVKYYNSKGKVNDKEFEIDEVMEYSKPNKDLIDQYIYIYNSNQRMGLAKAKDRGEVSGGGKKPWRQKGTGRARHGSTRSPIWKGGGVTFGPTGTQNYKKTMPKKMKRAAFLSALNIQIGEDSVKVLEGSDCKKTKQVMDLLNNIYSNGYKNILVVQPSDTIEHRFFNNIEGVKVVRIQELNTYDIAMSKEILFFEKAINELVNIYKTI